MLKLGLTLDRSESLLFFFSWRDNLDYRSPVLTPKTPEIGLQILSPFSLWRVLLFCVLYHKHISCPLWE